MTGRNVVLLVILVLLLLLIWWLLRSTRRTKVDQTPVAAPSIRTDESYAAPTATAAGAGAWAASRGEDMSEGVDANAADAVAESRLWADSARDETAEHDNLATDSAEADPAGAVTEDLEVGETVVNEPVANDSVADVAPDAASGPLVPTNVAQPEPEAALEEQVEQAPQPGRDSWADTPVGDDEVAADLSDVEIAEHTATEAQADLAAEPIATVPTADLPIEPASDGASETVWEAESAARDDLIETETETAPEAATEAAVESQPEVGSETSVPGFAQVETEASAETAPEAAAGAEDAPEASGAADATDEAPHDHPVVDGGWSVGSAAPNADGCTPLGHPIKGVFALGIYQVPGSDWYDATEPDVWFTDEITAQRAGFHRGEG